MGRAPCCEKMGLKKGPWTPEEDQILVDYIQKFGHGNWRALPKQAGLLRCGKSCRLRWVNYLRPDIKRGNFTKEEEDKIISLHEMLGNRWSVIAAKLPGRTDNEIKNVWHTHLKKRANSDIESNKPKKRTASKSKGKKKSGSVNMKPDTDDSNAKYANSRQMPTSPEQSCSELSPSASDSSTMTAEMTNNTRVKDESFSSEEFPESLIDESFWMETLSMNNYNATSFTEFEVSDQLADIKVSPGPSSANFSDMDYWLNVFTDAGGLQDLPEI